MTFAKKLGAERRYWARCGGTRSAGEKDARTWKGRCLVGWELCRPTDREEQVPDCNDVLGKWQKGKEELAI